VRLLRLSFQQQRQRFRRLVTVLAVVDPLRQMRQVATLQTLTGLQVTLRCAMRLI
jgi:hypothetical protein